jgi:3'-phosphoadenosine 5'-phosphosulfate sulfotransferase (PAPS reductase)/FAD synthetase
VSIDEQLVQSQFIMAASIAEIQPKVTVALVSGGTDSLTAFYVAQALEIPIDYIVHVHTGTGVLQTLDFVEQWAEGTGIPLLLCDAERAYENYVLRKGFFGRGVKAHAMSYHILKADPLRKGMSKLRQGRRDYPIMMLTGIRLDESDNRKYNFAAQTVKRDPAAPNNIFVNLIEHWTQADCNEFLTQLGVARNPVAKALHRSAECMCGTMQTKEDRQLASIMYPEWGKWLDTLEATVKDLHGWAWDQNIPRSIKQEKAGQIALPGFELCRRCVLNGEVENVD